MAQQELGKRHQEQTKIVPGQEIGKWKILRKSPRKTNGGYRHYVCLCTLCNREYEVEKRYLVHGKSSSCVRCAASARGRAGIRKRKRVRNSNGQEFDSASQAAVAFGVTSSAISSAIYYGNKSGGVHWSYVEQQRN